MTSPALSKLLKESDFVERLMRTAHAIVLFMDTRGRVVLFNDFMRDLCGYDLEEVRGEDWFDLFIPERDREGLRRLYAAALEGVAVRSNVNAILTKAGEERQVEWWGDVVLDEHGGILGLLSVGQDISERVELRSKLAESERLASIGMMASVFAHEVGNPLNAMYLQAQLLRRRIDRPARGELGPHVDALLGEIQRLNTLLDEFRSYHRPAKLQLALTDVGEILRRVQHVLSPQARDRAIRLECEIAEGLPLLMANANKLKQVFLNLCKNGFEAMHEGGEVLRMCAFAEDGGIRVEVADEGVGIAEGLDVFAPFATSKSSGMGLGLALVRDIVRAHGGEISYVSERGRGTVFTVWLPRRPPTEQGDETGL